MSTSLAGRSRTALDETRDQAGRPDVGYLVVRLLNRLRSIPHLAAIALEGAKGVGKTATATQRVTTVLSLNNPTERTAVASHLDLVTEVPGPVLIDEWQLEPYVWDRVRRAVDDDPTGGRFLLAGSAGVAPGGAGALRCGPDREPDDAAARVQRAGAGRTGVRD